MWTEFTQPIPDLNSDAKKIIDHLTFLMANELVKFWSLPILHAKL
jgi:hypothetical protein